MCWDMELSLELHNLNSKEKQEKLVNKQHSSNKTMFLPGVCFPPDNKNLLIKIVQHLGCCMGQTYRAAVGVEVFVQMRQTVKLLAVYLILKATKLIFSKTGSGGNSWKVKLHYVAHVKLWETHCCCSYACWFPVKATNKSKVGWIIQEGMNQITVYWTLNYFSFCFLWLQLQCLC